MGLNRIKWSRTGSPISSSPPKYEAYILSGLRPYRLTSMSLRGGPTEFDKPKYKGLEKESVVVEGEKTRIGTRGGDKKTKKTDEKTYKDMRPFYVVLRLHVPARKVPHTSVGVGLIHMCTIVRVG
jgi:hypothetical protein